jgi:hypothetical protein
MVVTGNFVERSFFDDTNLTALEDYTPALSEKIAAVIKKALNKNLTFVLEDPKTNKLIKKIIRILKIKNASCIVGIERIKNLCLQKLSSILSPFHQKKIGMILDESYNKLVTRYRNDYKSEVSAVHEQLALLQLNKEIGAIKYDLDLLELYPPVSADEESISADKESIEEPPIMLPPIRALTDEPYLSPKIGYEYCGSNLNELYKD